MNITDPAPEMQHRQCRKDDHESFPQNADMRLEAEGQERVHCFHISITALEKEIPVLRFCGFLSEILRKVMEKAGIIKYKTVIA